MGALKDTFDACQRSPEAFAFLCDELARAVARKAIGRCCCARLGARGSCCMIGCLHAWCTPVLPVTRSWP